jgi:hypothetical protein
LPIFLLDHFPSKPWLACSNGVPSMSINKTPHFASQRRILAGPRKEGIQAVSFHDNAGRAAFDDEV